MAEFQINDSDLSGVKGKVAVITGRIASTSFVADAVDSQY
jgi:hypothetical protein